MKIWLRGLVRELSHVEEIFWITGGRFEEWKIIKEKKTFKTLNYKEIYKICKELIKKAFCIN